ncbi:MAG: glycosyltransferase family 2 protein [Phycicoccus sp.]|nr:glycosyltransferase family 2 protein [Phycicoccus sp.]
MTLAPPRDAIHQLSPNTETSPTSDQGVPRPAVRPVIVTGVLVVHDGAAWLNECLDALGLQTRPLDRLVIVDTGSTDDSRLIAASHERIRQAIGDVQTITATRGSTFGDAVGRAVDHLLARSVWSVGAIGGDPSLNTSTFGGLSQGEWLWLLHDDSAAEPRALDHLLDAARRSPSVGVAGPKLTTWDDPSRLLQVGQQVTRAGGRAGGPAPGEPDQGQHDHRGDVLSVNTSGMLIRREVFDSIGGFDPKLGQFGDGLDLCWRAHLAGHRVVVVPRARMREAAATANGARSTGFSADAARRRDRSHGRQVALARSSPYAVPFLALWIAAASLVSAAVLLVVKQPRRAWDELGDLGSLFSPWRPLAARWRARGVRRIRRRDLRGLFVSPRDGFHQALDAVHEAAETRSASSSDDRVGIAQALETGPVSEDSESLEGLPVGVVARVVRHPGFLAVLVGALLSIATWRSLIGKLISPNGLGVAGGELFPVSGDASGLWHAWLDGWHGAGLGNAIEPAPYLPVLSSGAWVVEHLPFIDAPTASVGVAISWLLAGAIPLSAWTAYLAARVATRAPWPRAWAALAWASLATLTTAQASGRLGAVVAHILLPVVAAGFVGATRRSTRASMTFGTALAMAVLGAFNPVLALLAAVFALVLIVVGHGTTRLHALLLLLVPVGLLGPWILRLVADPLLLLGGPGLARWHDETSAPWQLALLHPGGPGSYPVLLSAPLVLAGVVALIRRDKVSRAMTALAFLAVFGMALGLASPHVIAVLIPADMAGSGAPITVWAGTGLDIAALALIAAAVLGFDGLAGRLSHAGFGWRQVLVAPVVVAAVLGMVARVAWAGWLGVGHTVTATTPGMPAVAADQAQGPVGSRLLVLNRDAGVIGYRLLGSEPGTIVRDLPTVAAEPDPLLAATVKIALDERDGTSVNAARNMLADLGVGFVGFRGAPTEPLVRRLDATAGLTRLGDSQALILWRVLPLANAMSSSRLRLEDATGVPLHSISVTGDHGQTDVRVGVATARVAAVGRRLVVAEPPGWADHARVMFSGRELTAIGGGGQPAYDLPSSAGRLTITLAPSHPWWRWGQLGLLLAVIFLAAPFGSSRRRRTS